MGRDFKKIEREINERLDIISGIDLGEACDQARRVLRRKLA